MSETVSKPAVENATSPEPVSTETGTDKESAEGYGPKVQKAASSNMGAMLGGLIAGGVAMFGLEMGFVGTLMVGLIGAILGSAFIDGENGVFGGLISAFKGHGKETSEKDKTPTQGKDAPAAGKEEPVKANAAAVGKDDAFLALDADGKLVAPDKAQLLVQGHYEGDKFIITKAATPGMKEAVAITDAPALAVKDGVVDLANAENKSVLETLRKGLAAGNKTDKLKELADAYNRKEFEHIPAGGETVNIPKTAVDLTRSLT